MVKNSPVFASVTLMLVLILSVGSSVSASAGLSSSYAKTPLVEHHKPDHDNGGGNRQVASGEKGNGGPKDKQDKGKRDIFGPTSMLQPVPAAFDEFELTADGSALEKRDGKDGPLTDAEIKLRASVIREEGNHFRFYATGTVEINDDEYDIVDSQGIIIFFKNPRGKSILGLVHIAGKHAVDEDGNDLGKFRLRALVTGGLQHDKWNIMVYPAGKLGKEILLLNMQGSIGRIAGEPPAQGNSSLHHFVVGSIPSSVPAGSAISVTVTAHMSNGTLLKTYEGKAEISDGTASVKPVITPRFQDGVLKGFINITKTSASNKVKFADVETGRFGESNSFAVDVGTLANVILTPSEVKLNPGSKAQFEAKGTDKFGNELPGLTFSWALSSQDYGSISTFGSKANFTAGSSVSSNVTLDLTVSVGSKSDKSQISISPSSSIALDRFVIGNISSLQVAGQPFQFTVKAVNGSGATLTGYAGPLHLSDTTGSLNMTVSAGFVNGVWTGNANITEADDEVRITAEDISSETKGSSNKFAVVAGQLHHFEFNEIGNQTAGTQFNLTVKARDAYGNLVTNFQGNVTLATNDGASPAGNATVFAPETYNFTASDGGQHVFSTTMYNAKQDVTVTANGSGKSGVSNEFDVRSADVAKITVSPNSATVSPAGKATFGALAFDAYGNAIASADFQWSLDSDVLGDIDELTASTAEFTASSGILSTASGTVSAQVGSVTGTASVTVQV
jgi:hypothetical protein